MRKTLSSFIVNIPSRFALIFVKISFTNNVKSKEELGSPCFTPRWDSIVFVICLLYFIADFTDEYMALIA